MLAGEWVQCYLPLEVGGARAVWPLLMKFVMAALSSFSTSLEIASSSLGILGSGEGDPLGGGSSFDGVPLVEGKVVEGEMDDRGDPSE